VIFLDRIQVFDKDNLRIGETYPRRAKQLVLNGRATWTDGKLLSIRLVDMLTDADTWEDKQMDISKEHSEHIEEVNTAITEESIDRNNDEAQYTEDEPVFEEAEPAAQPSEDLLMYLARQNVARRYNLLYHVVLLPVTFIVLVIVTSGFRFGSGFYVGFFFAWGLLIAYKAYVIISAWLMSRPKADKVDRIQSEYERLKNMPPKKIRM